MTRQAVKITMLLWMALYSCRVSEVETVSELLSYINKDGNGLTKRHKVSGGEVVVSYHPTDLLISQDFSNGISIDSLRKKYANYIYFKLSFIGINEPQTFSFLETASFYLHDYIYIIDDGGTRFDLIYSVFDRTFNLGLSQNILLVFDKAILDGKIVTLVVNDFGLNIPIQQFEFREADINNTPKLIFTKTQL